MTEIQKFYAKKTVFLTGASGYIGKLVLEKLLRSCPDISKVYILLREKRSQSVENRLENLLLSPIWSVLEKEQPLFKNKIQLIHGDCSLPKLGISPTDYTLLSTNTNIIIHCAANVRFDDPLPITIRDNVMCVRELLELCKRITHLQACVVVSTAFSNCPWPYIDETFYPCRIKPDTLIRLVQGDTHFEVLEALTPILKGKWPNTYSFSKNIAENLIQQEGKGLPVCILRPSIVTGCETEPMPGYCETLNASDGLSYFIQQGLIRVVFCDLDYHVEVIPGDYVASTIIAAAWEQTFLHKATNKLSQNEEAIVYNVVGCNKNPLTNREYGETMLEVTKSVASPRMIWYPNAFATKNYYFFKLMEFILHGIPLYMADLLLIFRGKPTRYVKIFQKMKKQSVYAYFLNNEWGFGYKNMDRLVARMSPEDKIIFKLDTTQFDYQKYAFIRAAGIRKYIIKDYSSVEDGLKHYYKLRRLHYGLLFIFTLLAVLIIRFLLF